jgi:microcystin-dependent protein
MGQPYVGEIRLFAGNFAPNGWNFCDGSLVSIAENEVLFQLIGTTYGGDGVSTYALPDLRSRVPVHQGFSPGGTFVIGQNGGLESVTLTIAQLPAHSHLAQANSAAGNQSSPNGGVWAQSTLDQFSSATPATPMAGNAVALTGGSQPHDNMLPFLGLSFIISMFGVFPSQN